MIHSTELHSMHALRAWVRERYGLWFPDAQLPALHTRVRRAMRSFGVESVRELLAAVQARPERHAHDLITAITIGETYFFRNEAQFSALRYQVLPYLTEHLGRSSPLVVWCAGCATGEEPYSIAMWVREYAPSLWPNRIRVIGTDINPQFLEQARAGRFAAWSFRRTAPFWQQRYFTKHDDHHHIDPAIRSVVNFSQHNLASGTLPESIFPGAVSLILCRNVLIYFDRETSAQAQQTFRRGLLPHGALFLGHAESLLADRRWSANYYPGTFYYRLPAGEPSAPVSTPSEIVRSGDAKPTPRSDAGAQRDVKTSRSTTELLELAKRKADAGSWAAARDLLEQLCQRDPTVIEAHVLRALVEEQLGDAVQARGALRKAAFLDRHLVIAHYLLGVLDEVDGALDDSLRRYRTVSRLLLGVEDDVPIPHADGLVALRMREIVNARVTELTRQRARRAGGGE